MKILLIIDDPHWREMLSRYITRAGYEVVLADSGYEGMFMADSHHPDMVICDIGMPNGNGYDVLRHVRRDEALRHIPVIACGRDNRGTDEFDGVLLRDSDPTQVVETVKVLLSGRR